MNSIPEGFKENPMQIGLMKTLGPYYFKELEDGDFEFAFYADERHFNPVGALHGGALVSFIDNCMGQSLFVKHNEPNATISLTTDFVSSMMEAGWVFGRVEITRETRSIIFVRGEAYTRDKLLMSCSGVFKRIGR